MDYKVGEEIKILYDVFLPLSLCIKKFILASATNYFSTFCWTTVLDLCYLCCVLVIMQKENVLDCLLPRGMFLFVINIIFMRL